MTSPRNKHVLIFTTAYFPHVGGAEVAIQEITNRIQGYEFDLICARYERHLPKKERIGNVTVHRVGVGIRVLDKLLCPFLSTLCALELHKQHTIDMYWAMMVTYGSLGAYVTNILRAKQRTPVVLTLQEGDPPAYLRSKWFGLIALSWKFALTRSDQVTVISTYLAELAASFGYTKEAVCIPNGVSVDAFTKVFTPTEIAKTKEQLGKKEGDVYLVTTSRLVHKNAIDIVTRALALLPEQIQFLIYGVGPDEGALKALAHKLDVHDRVRFMGQVSHEVLPRILSVCDIFIRPSRSEGMGNSFIEAMAAGLPVIATQEGGIADFLFDAKRNPNIPTTGWAVAVDSPEDIARVVEEINSHPEEVARVRSNALALVREKYDWTKVAHAMQHVFDSLVHA